MSVRDVAEAAGVSVGTVSNVLNRPDRVAPETRARVQAAIQQVGFVRNEAARQLRVGSSPTIGLVVLDIANPFYAELLSGAEDRATEAGRTIVVANSAEVTARQDRALNAFEEQRVGGIVLAPREVDSARLRELGERGIRVVLVDHHSTDPSIPSVAVDNVAGGRLAVEHLLSLGRRRIAFVGSSVDIAQVGNRLRGARRAVDEVDDAHLDHVVVDQQTVAAGRRAARGILDGEVVPDAVFAANDLLAFGMLQEMRSRRISVPDDVALIGYDDIPLAAWLEVPLSTVRQPARDLGYRAIELLVADQGSEPGAPGRLGVEGIHETLNPELVVRATTTGKISSVSETLMA